MAKVQVRNKDNVKVITFGEQPARPASNLSGCIGQVSWYNPDTMKALRQMFAAKPGEEIVAVQITDDGIKVEFETK